MAAREARASFGDQADRQLGETLALVTETAKDLGVPVGDRVKAMLDAHSVSFSGGTISLHDEAGVPLRNLGLGSARLLIAGLQRKAAEQSPIILVDELEYGLEPHRIIRFFRGARRKGETASPASLHHNALTCCPARAFGQPAFRHASGWHQSRSTQRRHRG